MYRIGCPGAIWSCLDQIRNCKFPHATLEQDRLISLFLRYSSYRSIVLHILKSRIFDHTCSVHSNLGQKFSLKKNSRDVKGLPALSMSVLEIEDTEAEHHS
jgi:hypothetical protein